jgi:hypothetical protein
MNSAANLTHEEEQVVKRVNSYFKSSKMTMREKVFNAMLIAQHDLEAHHFCSEHERNRIAQFKDVLECLLLKLNN